MQFPGVEIQLEVFALDAGFVQRPTQTDWDADQGSLPRCVHELGREHRVMLNHSRENHGSQFPVSYKELWLNSIP